MKTNIIRTEQTTRIVTTVGKGPKGDTPYIQDGTWWINGVDTGEPAVGQPGATPEFQTIESGPVVSNTATSSSEITASSFKLTLNQATAGPQLFQTRPSGDGNWATLSELPTTKDNSSYEYEAYVGDLASVSDIDLVEQQTLAAAGTAVGELTIPGNQGNEINVGLIVKDDEGNKVLYDPITVTLLDPQVTDLTVTPNPVEVDKDATVQLVPDVTTVDGADDSVTYSSSNVAVATVSSTGLVTGIDAGSATITVRSVFDPNFFVELSVVTSSDAPPMPEWAEAGFSNTLTSITVDWFDVATADSFDVRINGGTPIQIPTATSHLFQNLTPGTQYLVEVRSSGAGGLSPWNSITVQTDGFTEVEESQTNQFTTA